jgi:hypothetical protein
MWGFGTGNNKKAPSGGPGGPRDYSSASKHADKEKEIIKKAISCVEKVKDNWKVSKNATQILA